MPCDPGLYSLRDASYRGVPFYVDNDKESYARRIVTHEIPNADSPVYEDLGERYASYTVTGYVWGSDSESSKDAVVAACVTKGAAILILPAVAPVSARCLSVSVQRSKDKIGWFELSMEFRREGSSSAMTPSAVYGRMISTLQTDAVNAYTGLLATVTTINQSTYVTEGVVSRIQDFSASMSNIIETTPVTEDT